MQPDPPPILSVRQTSGDLPSQAMFWDGNPEKQSFISIVGLSTPNTRPRPASAPARGSHASAFGSSRQDRPLSCTAEGSAECAAYGERYHHARGERKTSTNQEAGDRVETGRTRVLELRLRQLVRENASMRDALRDNVRETKHEQLSKAQRRELELIGGLQAAKESVDTKATGAPNRVRGPQTELREKKVQPEERPARQQRGFPSPRSKPNGRMASTSRPVSASRGRRQVNTEPVAPDTSATVTSDKAIPSPSRSLSREIGVGGRHRTDGAFSNGNNGGGLAVATKTTPNGQRGENGKPQLGEHHLFEHARPGNGGITSPILSPNNLKGMASSGKSAITTGSEPFKWARSTFRAPLRAPPRAMRDGVGAVDQTLLGQSDSDAEKAAAEDDQRRGKDGSGGGKDKADLAGGTRGGYTDSGGVRKSRSSTAPKVLLAREAQAAIRRAERAAAAKLKEEEQLGLSSSFRAKEINAASGPSWATIKAHQDIVRKQRIRDRAAFLAASSSLPARMARHAAMQDVAQDRAKSAAGRVKVTKEGGFVNAYEENDVGECGGHLEEKARKQPEDIVRLMHKRQERWEASLAAAKASSRTATTRPRTPPMEKRRMAQESKRRAREKAERIMREAAEKQRAEIDRRQFRRLIAVYQASGNTFRETKASVRKAEETRQKIAQDKEHEEQQQAAVLAEEARGREVSRAVREYVAASEAKRREEHGAGPPLEELVQRKKEEKKTELHARRRLNRSGLREALRKRPNLLERQEKYAQQHSKRLAAQASTARDFLEGREGFDAAGRRALGGGVGAGGDGGAGGREEWMKRAAADKSFSSREKTQLGLPVLPREMDSFVSSSGGRSTSRDKKDETGADAVITLEDKKAAGFSHRTFGDSGAADGLQARRGSDASLPVSAGAETLMLSSKDSEAAAAAGARKMDGDGDSTTSREEQLSGDDRDQGKGDTDTLKPLCRPDQNAEDVNGPTDAPAKQPPEQPNSRSQQQGSPAEEAQTGKVGDADHEDPSVEGIAL